MIKWNERIAEILADMAGTGSAQATKKSIMTVSDLASDGGLSTEEADRFVDLVVDESVLLQNIRVHRTTDPSGTISKLNITGPITKLATEGVATTTLSKPTSSSVEYATKKTVSAIDISGEVQEDNIEKDAGRNTIMGTMTKQIGTDMERLAIEGDTTVSGSTAEDLLMKANDGFLKLSASGTGATLLDAGAQRPTMLLLQHMMRQMSTKYRRDLSRLRWIMSANAALDLAEEIAGINPVYSAQIGGLADATKQSGMIPTLVGVRPLVVPMMPEDLALTGAGSGDTGSVILLCDPMNLIYVVQRALTIEWERVARADKWESTIHMRSDFIIEDASAIVKAHNIDMTTSANPYGADVAGT